MMRGSFCFHLTADVVVATPFFYWQKSFQIRIKALWRCFVFFWVTSCIAVTKDVIALNRNCLNAAFSILKLCVGNLHRSLLVAMLF